MPSQRTCLLGALFISFCCQVGKTQDIIPHRQLNQTLRVELEQLAQQCAANNAADLAETTRQWIVPADPQRQTLFLAAASDPTAPAKNSPRLTQFWHTHFSAKRTAYAAALFELAKQKAKAGEGAEAYRLLHEILWADPKHQPARQILAALRKPSDAAPRSSSLPRPPAPLRGGRWARVDSTHFRIFTNDGAAAGKKLAVQLEELDQVWRQLFFHLWSSDTAISRAFAAEGKGITPKTARRMEVVLERFERGLGAGHRTLTLKNMDLY